MPDDDLLAALASEVKRLGHLPTARDLQVRRHNDPGFPNRKAFERFGSKADLERTLAAYCDARADLADVRELLNPQPIEPGSDDAEAATAEGALGYVYMLKSGRYYKIGLTEDLGRRMYDLKIQLPEEAALVHTIRTDDPLGVERYWHQRFADRYKNGEWFELSKVDVAAFKKWKRIA